MTMLNPARSIAHEAMTLDGDDVRLLAGRCADCGTVTFPRQAGCPRCTGTNVDDHALATRGTLWTWTVQRFPPKAPPYVSTTPESFAPFGVGYVEVEDGVRIEGRLTEADPKQLRIGMPMELAAIEAPGDDPSAFTYAFRPLLEAK
jgi:uncharacterized OB-fold protein